MRAQELGVRIKRLRQRAGLTLRELADKVGIDFTYLSKIESGTVTAPSEAVIGKLAEVLRANREELLILAGKVPPDIVQMLREQGVIRHLRATRTRKIAREVRRERMTAIINRFIRPLKNIPRVVIPVALVVTLAASVWFASPVKAVETTLVDLPSTMSRGSTYSFYAQVDINANEAIPITNLRLDINGPSPIWVEFDAAGNITS